MKKSSGIFLPEDILVCSVLPLLPVKSLIRFKCVSKRWYNLISNNQSLILQQYENCRSLPCLNLQGLSTSESILRDRSSVCFRDLLPHMRGCEILSSCNGLVAMVFHRCQINPGNLTKQIIPELFVGNPLYQDWKWIPRYVPSPYETGLVFDPVNSFAHYELVCPCPTDFIHLPDGSEEIGFAVFSSETGEWKFSNSKVMAPEFSLRNHVCLGCILYWEMDDHVLWYDTKEDSSGLLPLPLAIDESSFGGCLNDANGYISYTRVAGHEIEIWDLNDFQWSKSHQFRLQNIVRRIPESLVSWRKYIETGFIYDEADRPSEGKSVFFVINRIPFSYDAKTGEVTEYQTNPFVPCDFFLYRANLFPTPGQQIFPLDWEQVRPEIEGYICFKGIRGGVLKISTRTAGNYQH